MLDVFFLMGTSLSNTNLTEHIYIYIFPENAVVPMIDRNAGIPPNPDLYEFIISAPPHLDHLL
jgi:hypothetical protein